MKPDRIMLSMQPGDLAQLRVGKSTVTLDLILARNGTADFWVMPDQEYLQNGWIPVQDRLPSNDAEVLVFNAQRRRCFIVSGRWLRKWGDAAYTHWMPLPFPPLVS